MVVETIGERRKREKIESRKRDQERLEAGEDPAVLQRENSIFPPDFFKGAKIDINKFKNK